MTRVHTTHEIQHTAKENDSKPLRRRRRDLDSPYLALGKLATNWAFIEYELDLWLVLIYANCRGELVKRKCPILFWKKLELFRKALNTEKQLSALEKAGLKIASKMSRLVRHRNNILHSTIRKFSPSSIIFAKHEWGERVPKPRFFTVKVSQVEKYAQVMEDFALELGFFGTQFESAFDA
jgi:hypothetical protein